MKRSYGPVRYLVFIVWSLTARPIPAVIFTQDTLISFNNSNYDGLDLVATNCTLTIDGVHSFASVRILNGAVLSHSSSSNGLLANLLYVTGEPHVISATNPATLNQTNIDASAVAITNAIGATNYLPGVDYRLASLPNGQLQVALLPGSAISEGALISVSYTVADPPVSAGLNLIVTNDVAVEVGGAIEAAGKGYGGGAGTGAGTTRSTNSPYVYSAGAGGSYGGFGGASSTRALGSPGYGAGTGPLDKGSGGGSGTGIGGAGGGAIHISAGGNIRVDGTITVNGADGLNGNSGGGAGGSIWLSAAAFFGAGSITANGGDGELFGGGGGGGGRIALTGATNQFAGTVLAVGGRGAMRGGAGTVYTLSGTNTVGQMTVDNAGLAGTNTTLAPGAVVDLIIGGGARVNAGLGTTLSSLWIHSNSWLVASSTPIPGAGIQLTVLGDAVIERNSGLTVDGSGFSAGQGPGAGKAGTSVYGPMAGGGGYGGAGGSARTNGAGGASYGSVSQPTDSGSGGGIPQINTVFAAGWGGGSIKLVVTGMLLLDGSVSANGLGGLGGGAGGSVWLNVGQLAGAGSIAANGGSGEQGFGGGGGGGRIAIYYGTNNYLGAITAYGGAGANYGGAGTIYLRTNYIEGFVPQVMVDNGGWIGTNTGLPSVEPCRLTVRGGATLDASSLVSLTRLQIGADSWLTFSTQQTTQRRLTVNGDVNIEAGGGIRLDGKGFQHGIGPGAGRPNSGGGAGYGGYGGNGITNSGAGVTYGLIMSTSELGSGGGSGVGGDLRNAFGGAGGGSLNLTVKGRLSLDGQITANGTSAAALGSGGGGSGGGLGLTLGALSGSGLISANGGSGDLPAGGGGGGGRIIITCATNEFVGLVTAYGGAGAKYGGAGTILVSAKSDSFGTVMVDNGGWLGTNTTVGEAQDFDLTVRGGGSVDGSTFFQVRNLHLVSGGHISFPGTPGSSGRLTVAGDALIEAGASIILDGAGGARGGPGAGRELSGGGGGYGGFGGNSLTNYGGGNAYGSTTQPIDIGSGGATITFQSAQTHAGYGGGALHLTVARQLTLDGVISANGTAPTNANSGGGSGGSIWLSVGALSGSGSISANGGPGDLPFGGGGGGGRIALYFSTNAFRGVLSARGGLGAHTGGAGTIYIKTNTSSSALVLVDNGSQPGANTGISVQGKFDLNVTGGAAAAITSQASLGKLFISSNSWVICSNQNVQLSTLISVAADAIIQSGGGILLDGLGYGANEGPGAGRSVANLPSGFVGSGAGHGGFGGSSSLGVAGGNAYGVLVQPVEPGSGGGVRQVPTLTGSSGGGALEFHVAGTLQLDGKVSANGLPGLAPGSGGGSGGGIYITAQKISGTGLISANGGAGQPGTGGGGGGGRISLSASTETFTGTIVAQGGVGVVNGGAGTICLHPLEQNKFPQVIIDNGGLRGTNTPLSALGFPIDLTVSAGAVASCSGAIVRNLLVTSNAWLGSPTSLTVNGDGTIQQGGGIIADGAGFAAGQGSGAGGTSQSSGFTFGGGGGHGGYGGIGGTAIITRGGNAYGDFLLPAEKGSGGGGANALGGAGGGQVWLAVAHTLLLDGVISADGFPSLSEAGGGGSGGSILLNVGRLSGEGSVHANGGSADPLLGGGGGGGRIALYLLTNDFAGTVSAFGGQGVVWGGAGTIYSRNRSNDFGNLLIDNGGWSGADTPIQTTQFLALRIVGGAVGVSSAALQLESLVLDSGAALTSPVLEALDLTVLGDALIGTNSALAVDGEGFTGLNDPGSGQNLPGGTGSGGGYGGQGGASASGQPGGGTHGSVEEPVDFGSRGGSSPVLPGSGEGGGAIRLRVGRNLTVNGVLSANGNPGLVEGGGGGSGGSVWITAADLEGTGDIQANGGAGEPVQGGGGGGGRIALYVGTNHFDGTITAMGAPGAAFGQDGSVLLTHLPQAQVISQIPTNSASSPVSSVDLVFDTLLDTNSVSTSGLALGTPNGSLSISDLSFPAPNALHIGFASQNAPGTYHIILGAPLRDMYGSSLEFNGSFVVLPPAISGQVLDGQGLPVSAVILNAGGGVPPVSTDSNGFYSITVPLLWSGVITPSEGGALFVPSARSYTSLGVSLTNQNFVMLQTQEGLLASQVQGNNLSMSWYGASNVIYQLFYSEDLIQWFPSDSAIPGVNARVNVALPIGRFPGRFFRLEMTP